MDDTRMTRKQFAAAILVSLLSPLLRLLPWSHRWCWELSWHPFSGICVPARGWAGCCCGGWGP